jgi:hypothetical protein
MVARAAIVAAALVAAGCAADEQRRPTAGGPAAANQPACETRPAQGDRRLRAVLRGHRPIVLGCTRTRAGRVVTLYAFRQAEGPCLVIAGLPGGPRACGRAPSERVPATDAALGGPVVARRSPVARLEVYGETAPEVRVVVVRYRLPVGRSGEREATLIRAEDPTALRAARVPEPFGYFTGAVPAPASRVTAVALDASGEAIGRLGFDQVADLHPTVFIAVEP